MGQLISRVDLRDQVYIRISYQQSIKGGSLISGRTCPAMSVVAKAVEEYDRGRERGGGSWGGDDDRWSFRHGQQRPSIEDVEAIFAWWCYRMMLKRGVSVAEVLSNNDPSARQSKSIP